MGSVLLGVLLEDGVGFFGGVVFGLLTEGLFAGVLLLEGLFEELILSFLSDTFCSFLFVSTISSLISSLPILIFSFTLVMLVVYV